MRIRLLEERLARERLLLASRDLRRARDAFDAVDASLRRLALATGPTSIGHLHWVADQAERLAGQRHDTRTALDEASDAREAASRAWDVARRRAEVLERLRADGVARWRDDLRREETAELDDLATIRHGARVGTS
jgi:hypothetical protein